MPSRVGEGAEPLRLRVEGIARPGPDTAWSAPNPCRYSEVVIREGTPFGSLTGREREILGHLVEGRTYAEIARTLFISEKTVSVHASNCAPQDRHHAPGTRCPRCPCASRPPDPMI